MNDIKQEPQPPTHEYEKNMTGALNNKSTRKRKKKVEIACVYCRRSHMICDEGRPCQRCIKRGIGHICYDEPSNPRQRKKIAAFTKKNSSNDPEGPEVKPEMYMADSKDKVHALNTNVEPKNYDAVNGSHPLKNINSSVLSQTLPYNQESFFYSQHAGSEFSSLNEFLSIIDDPDLVNGQLNEAQGTTDPLFGFDMGNNYGAIGNIDMPAQNISNTKSQAEDPPKSFNGRPGGSNFGLNFPQSNNLFSPSVETTNVGGIQEKGHLNQDNSANQNVQAPMISDSARDKFFLTAADPTTEISPEERLKQVIKAKLEAGLLQPYNYANGYARLQSYMDNYMNASSRQRILKPLSVFRPAFRAIARTLKDVDLVLVEESFERMLLDYDRVFTSMAIPACLWRRTGEIYRGNKEFASLVGVMTDDLKDGKLAIYELMSEESAVNFWEKYGAIAFDKGQKAVLTTCNLRTRDGIKRKSCCFSFTIRRDRYNIPSCIVGNFIPIDP